MPQSRGAIVNGFEVLQRIKQRSALQGVPVIVLTSSLEESDRQRTRELGAVGFFSKPPNPEKLRQIFEALTGFTDRRDQTHRNGNS